MSGTFPYASKIVCVQGLPIAPSEKYGKQLSIMTTVTNRIKATEPANIYLPKHAKTGVTLGLAFIMCRSNKMATTVEFGLHNWPMDVKYTTTVRQFCFHHILYVPLL